MELSFQFSNFADFIEMAGHGLYVWICYFITAAGFSVLGLMPYLKTKTFIRIQRAIYSRQHN